MAAPSEGITKLLQQLGDGQTGAVDALMPLVYTEQHAMAQRQPRRERSNHTLNSTAIGEGINILGKSLDADHPRMHEARAARESCKGES